MTIKEKMHTIDEQINYLQRERLKLEQDRIAEFQDAHRKNIGRCFRTSAGRYCIITDIPRPEYMRNEGFTFNQCQFPAFFLDVITDNADEGIIPFWDEDTAFSKDGEHFGRSDALWDEITIDEFKAEFNKRLTLLWDRVFQNIKTSEEGGDAQ